MAEITQQVEVIRSHFRKHPRYRFIEADPNNDAIAVTGVVSQRRHGEQAIRFAEHCWRPILNNVGLSRTLFLLGALLKHVLVFTVMASVMHVLAYEVPFLAFLDEWGMAVMALAVLGFLAIELGAELINSFKEEAE